MSRNSLGGDLHHSDSSVERSRPSADFPPASQVDLLALVPDAVVCIDDDYFITYWNSAAEALFGWNADEVVGKRSDLVLGRGLVESGRPESLSALFRKGEHVARMTCTHKAGHAIETESKAKVTTRSGKHRYAVFCFRDISHHLVAEAACGACEIELARRSNEERETLKLHSILSDIDAVIHERFCHGDFFNLILPKAVEGIGAHSGAVAYREGGHWKIRHEFGLPGDIVNARMSFTNAPLVETAWRSGELLIVEDVSQSPEAGQSLLCRATRAGAMILAPIVVCGSTAGVMVFNFSQPRAFSHQERWFAQRLSASLGLALANIQLYQAEHAIAERLQDTLLALPSKVRGVAFSRAYNSATHELGRVGGDFLDIFEAQAHLLGITLGDVSGKGLDAAVTTSLIRTALRVHAIEGLPPEWVAMKVNEVVHRFTETSAFVTLWFGLLDVRTGVLTYVSAGHPPALVVPDNGASRMLACKNPILGAFEHTTYFASSTILEHGDRLMLYSDGVTEARCERGRFFKIEGLLESVERYRSEPTDGIAGKVMSDVLEFSSGNLRDDAALLVVEPTRLRGKAARDVQDAQALLWDEQPAAE